MTTPQDTSAKPDPADSYGYLAIILAWIIPGLGHFVLGQRARGIIFAITIHVLFALGLLIAGVRAISPPDQAIWGYTQWMAGWPQAVAYSASAKIRSPAYQADLAKLYDKQRPDPDSEDPAVIAQRKDRGKEFLKDHPIFAYHPKIQDVGAVYCGIAGMLNMLVMLDVYLRISGAKRESQSQKKKPAPRSADPNPAAAAGENP